MNKEILILIFAFFYITNAASQDTIYFDKFQNLSDKSSAFYFQVEHKDISNPERLICEAFYINGSRKEIKFYSKSSKGIRFGTEKKWYPNGQIKSQATYEDGKLIDTLYTYWENGILKRKDYFNQGIFSAGTCYDQDGNKIRHFDYEEMPCYPGGDNGLFTYIYNKIKMPEVVLIKQINIKVIAKFSVDINGNVNDIEIVKGDYSEANNEVIRVISSLKKFKPGLIDGEPVKVWYSIPIQFELK